MGEGEHQYEAIHDWGELPSNIKYGNTHSVVEDSQGHIFIHHTVHKDSPSLDAVVVFDDKGKFVRSFGPMFHGGAHGMHYAKEGKNEYLYFCDEKHGIVTKRTMKGEEVWTLGYPQDSSVYMKGLGASGPGGAAGLNYRPTNIAIAPNLDFWVVDGYGSYYAFHYSQKDGYPKLVNTFGGRPAPARAAGGGGGGRGKQGGGASGCGRRSSRGRTSSATRGRSSGPDEQSSRNLGGHARSCQADVAVGRPRQSPHRSLHLGRQTGRRHRRNACTVPLPRDERLIVVPDLQCRVTLFDKDNKVITHLGRWRLCRQAKPVAHLRRPQRVRARQVHHPSRSLV